MAAVIRQLAEASTEAVRFGSLKAEAPLGAGLGMGLKFSSAMLLWSAAFTMIYLVGVPIAIVYWEIDKIAWIMYASTLVVIQALDAGRELEKIDRAWEREGSERDRN